MAVLPFFSLTHRKRQVAGDGIDDPDGWTWMYLGQRGWGWGRGNNGAYYQRDRSFFTRAASVA